MLVTLARRYAFGDLAALVDAGATGRGERDLAAIEQLCAYGQRLLDLDAEDFGAADAARDSNVEASAADRVAGDAVPEPLRRRALACRMPQSAGERPRGSMATLLPTYRLLLEVIAVRWRRRETAALLAAVHISSEYLPLLAWQQVLGHAGDPTRLGADVLGPGSRWGDMDAASCPHGRAEKSAARKAARVGGEPVEAWRAYLDRQHSTTAHAFAVCAAECHRPCSVLTRWPAPRRTELAVRCRLAQAYADSPLVRLRHAAPVGHGFGVPAPGEVAAAWARTRDGLGRLEPAVRVDDGFPLPGLPGLFGAVAGESVTPDTMLADTAAALVAALDD